MEELLSKRAADFKVDRDDAAMEERSSRYLSFAIALRDWVPLWNATVNSSAGSSASESLDSKRSLAQWLYAQCQELQRQPEDALALAAAILSTCQTQSSADPIELQSALFDIIGESERATDFLFKLVPLVDDLVQYKLTPDDLSFSLFHFENGDEQERRRHTLQTNMQVNLETLRYQALEAAQHAAILKAQLEVQSSNTMDNRTDRTTHTLHTRGRDKAILKEYKRAVKDAAQALHRAQQQGAIFQDDPILQAIQSSADASASTDETSALQLEQLWRSEQGGRGLLSLFSQHRIDDLTSQLLPENSRVYYTPKSLPTGTTREHKEGYEIVTIPPPSSSVYADTSTRFPRLVIHDVMNPIESIAFEGTDTLNPMQSAVFQTAFHTRENMLICAPVRLFVKHNCSL